MKKVLLFSFLMCLSWALVSQKPISRHAVSAKYDPAQVVALEKETSGPVAVTQKASAQTTVGGRDLTFVDIGESGNAFGIYGNPRTYVWADPRINSVAFAHRMIVESGTFGNSRIAYDVSWNGGANGSWTNNVQVYNPLGSGGTYPQAAGRYPQGGIFNPPGNTDPDNAYYAYFIPAIDNSNPCSGTWGGLGYGVNGLTNCFPPAPTQTNVTTDDEIGNAIPDAFTITQDGHVWMVQPNYLGCVSPNEYPDGYLQVWHGQWDAGENDIVYEVELLEISAANEWWNDQKVAFAPDGQTGYISIMTSSDSEPLEYNGYHPTLYKTTDGGQSWDGPIEVALGGYDGIESIKNFWPDETLLQLEDYQMGFDRDTVWYNLGYHHDMVVDAYGNPHITGLITIASPGGWYLGAGVMATWHLYSNDGGETWDAVPLYENLTFDGEVGGANAISLYNRPQISSDITGKFLFISCLDTDFTGVTDNNQPDIFMCAYDVDKDEYTDMVNVTEFTPAWLIAFEASQSHYVFSEVDGSTVTCTVPFVYMEIGKNDLGEYDGGLQANFWYINGLTYEFTVESPYQPPTGLTGSYLCYDATLNWLAPGVGSPIGYNIYRNNVKINADPVTALTYTDAGVEPGTQAYKVTAVYSGGESVPTNTVTLNVESLDPVTNLVIDNVLGEPDVYLSWTAPAKALNGYNVYRNETLLTTTPITATSYNDLGLANGSYTYCIKAVYQTECESEAVCGEQPIIIAVGIRELENSFSIYPNPANESLTMQFTVPVNTVKILNDMGAVVYSSEKVGQNGILKVNVSSFEPGIYFVQVTTDKGIATKKVTVN